MRRSICHDHIVLSYLIEHLHCYGTTYVGSFSGEPAHHCLRHEYPSRSKDCEEEGSAVDPDILKRSQNRSATHLLGIAITSTFVILWVDWTVVPGDVEVSDVVEMV